jgi:hypothetical protein
MGFLSLAEFAAYLAPFGIFAVRGEDGVWSSPVFDAGKDDA